MSEDPPRSADLPPGYDEQDPYEGEDLSTYPEWWRRNIEEFREHGMRPYRPPRFADGELTPPMIASLEEEFGVEIQFRSLNPQEGGGWDLVVDGETVGSVERHREGEGYSLYQMTSDEFDAAVRSAVG